jgi:hypothetical protein
MGHRRPNIEWEELFASSSDTSETELLVEYVEQCKARLEHEGWQKLETRP